MANCKGGDWKGVAVYDSVMTITCHVNGSESGPFSHVKYFHMIAEVLCFGGDKRRRLVGDKRGMEMPSGGR
jgi:hypothetical protein